MESGSYNFRLGLGGVDSFGTVLESKAIEDIAAQAEDGGLPEDVADQRISAIKTLGAAPAWNWLKGETALRAATLYADALLDYIINRLSPGGESLILQHRHQRLIISWEGLRLEDEISFFPGGRLVEDEKERYRLIRTFEIDLGMLRSWATVMEEAAISR